MLSGLCEEAEEPIARTEEETLFVTPKAEEDKTESFEFEAFLNWVFEEMNAVCQLKL